MTPQDIKDQRAKGWPDFHPEDYCHRCARPNIVWYVSSAFWNAAKVEEEIPSGILCPTCFVEKFEQQGHGEVVWELKPDVLTMHHMNPELRDKHQEWLEWQKSTLTKD